MVEHTLSVDAVFQSLSDPTRRDILQRVSRREMSVGELVKQYNISFAAISKHIKVLEKAKMITKRKEGRKHMVAMQPSALKEADKYLEQYRQMWQGRYDKLDQLLKEGV